MENPIYRIVSGEASTVENTVNSLTNDYTPMVWNFQRDHGETIVTCVLISNLEARRQILSMPIPPAGALRQR
jgi:hypothetical protein